jgi:FMN phosphatase YigB (HAD superfamily)
MTGRRGETGAALFDFDGTLIDSFSPRKTAHKAVGEFLSRYMRSHRCELKRNALLGQISRLEGEMNKRRVYDRNRWWEEILRGYLEEGIQIPPSILTEASSLYWETIKRESRVYPGVGHMLQSLKQRAVTVGLITDTDGLGG